MEKHTCIIHVRVICGSGRYPALSNTLCSPRARALESKLVRSALVGDLAWLLSPIEYAVAQANLN